ncbi:hypothetical protein LSAT2_030204 [Lamellibrachia satsuma]|nr:hypothetical protein LSAT2_030204 [Lamellibrachia satsuma]
MDWNPTKHQSTRAGYSSPSTLSRMTPEFDQESYDTPLRRSRYGEKHQSRDSHHNDHWGESPSDDEDDDYSSYHHNSHAPYQMVMYPVLMPQQPYAHPGHRSRKSKKQVRYRNTPTIFSSGSAPMNTRHGLHDAAPHLVYRQMEPDEEYFLNHPVFAKSIVDDVIEDSLKDEIIPDILEDVITERFRMSMSPKSEPDEKWSPRTNSTYDLLTELVTEVVTEESVGAVRGALRELVTEYTQLSVVENLVQELLQEAAPVVVNEVLGEATEEDIVEKEYVRQEVDAVATAVAVEVLRYYTDKKRIHEIKKVEQYAVKKMVDTACLDKLLSIVTGLGVAEVADELADKPLDDMILTILLDGYMDVYFKQRSTLDNAPLKRWHKNLFADVALDLILGELCHSLDEDLADLDDYELSFDTRTTAELQHSLTDR